MAENYEVHTAPRVFPIVNNLSFLEMHALQHYKYLSNSIRTKTFQQRHLAHSNNGEMLEEKLLHILGQQIDHFDFTVKIPALPPGSCVCRCI
jgi:hypothetical protein